MTGFVPRPQYFTIMLHSERERAVSPHLSAARSGLRRAARAALDAILPPQCLSCKAATNEPGTLCAPCWRAIQFLAPPFCARCGFPFEYDSGKDALCGACSRLSPAFDRARAVLRYDDSSRGLILAFKHADKIHAAPAFGRWMARAGAGLLAEGSIVVPVPLHWTRLFRRRYNQAALLALALARETGLRAAPDLLIRRRATPSQGRLGAAARRRNVAGAFAVRPRGRDLIDGRRVLLVDDVLTTGATVDACARALKRAGADAVDVLVLGRVVREAWT